MSNRGYCYLFYCIYMMITLLISCWCISLMIVWSKRKVQPLTQFPSVKKNSILSSATSQYHIFEYFQLLLLKHSIVGKRVKRGRMIQCCCSSLPKLHLKYVQRMRTDVVMVTRPGIKSMSINLSNSTGADAIDSVATHVV